MSEAFEIGFELAEQEELSGSLEIILQGLTSLDAAIAASNSDILALMGGSDPGAVPEVSHRHVAGVAPEVQAARGAMVSRAETTGEKTFGSGDGETTTAPLLTHMEGPFDTRMTPAAAPSAKSEELPAAQRAGLIAVGGKLPEPAGGGIVAAPITIDDREQTALIAGAARPNELGERPEIPSVMIETGLAGSGGAPSGNHRRVEIGGREPAPTGGIAFRPETVAPRHEASFRGSNPGATDVPRFAVAPGVDGMSGGVSGPVLPWGEAGRSLRDGAEAPAVERGGQRSFGAATAPQMGRGDISGAPAGMFSERAAAPQGEAGSRQDDGRAIVMLDGRLVGEMLSGRMARDAARPGAGTTFFDPRQAPAWTPSGSL